MKLDKLTLGQIKELQNLFNSKAQDDGINFAIGQKVIVRTYDAGVHYGTLVQKAGKEVILENARRMWSWKTNKGISLSSCAVYGVYSAKSKITNPVPQIWLEAIEIIPCSEAAVKSIEECPHVEAE